MPTVTPNLKIKRLTDTAIIPTYAHASDSGMDLYYDGEDIDIEPAKFTEVFSGNCIYRNPNSNPEFTLACDRYLLSTGISIELPPFTEAQIRPRSGLALKLGMTVFNSPGTVDEGYTGEIKVMLINLSGKVNLIKRGDRIAQMVICPIFRCSVQEVDVLEESHRGVNGFGSTGN